MFDTQRANILRYTPEVNGMQQKSARRRLWRARGARYTEEDKQKGTKQIRMHNIRSSLQRVPQNVQSQSMHKR